MPKYYNDDAKRTKDMYRQRIQKAWGHTAYRGWAHLLLLNRARDLIIPGPAHRGANAGDKSGQNLIPGEQETEAEYNEPQGPRVIASKLFMRVGPLLSFIHSETICSLSWVWRIAS